MCSISRRRWRSRPTAISSWPKAMRRRFGNSRIMKFDKNGKFIKTFGHLGSGDGEFKSPHVIAFDSQGRLFVADRSNSRVDIFDQDGKFLAAWKQFGRPSGIWIDKNDVLYVADSESEDAPGKDTQQSRLQARRARRQREDGKGRLLHPAATGVRPETPAAGRCRRRIPTATIYLAAVQAKSVYKYVKN